MHLHPIAQTVPIRGIGSAWDALARLAGPPRNGASETDGDGQTLPPAVLSRSELRTLLIAGGMEADEPMMALADSFSRLGAPLDESTLAAARAILARMPDIKPAAIALSYMLNVGSSPAAIAALSKFLDGIPDADDAGEIASVLTLVVGEPVQRSALASSLKTLISSLSRSVENRLADGATLTGDARAKLLMLADALEGRPGQIAANTEQHAAAQQLMNQSSIARFDPPVPLYFGFYVQEPGGRRSPAEMQIWSRPERDGDARNPDNEEFLNATVRVTPSLLGLIQITLNGTLGGQMKCRLTAQKLLTFRLMRRHASDLASALTSAGWDVRGMEVAQSTDFPPLWYAGAALQHPRSRIDWKA